MLFNSADFRWPLAAGLVFAAILMADLQSCCAQSKQSGAGSAERTARPVVNAFHEVVEQDAVARNRRPVPDGVQRKTTRFPLSGAEPEQEDERSAAGSSGQLLFALLVVVGIILACSRLLNRTVTGPEKPDSPTEPFEVLIRRTVDQRNSVCLIRLGEKLVLLGTSTNGLTPLAEIDDPIEVATLINQCRAAAESPASVGKWLGLFSGRSSSGAPPSREASIDLRPQPNSPSNPGDRLVVRPAQEERHVA